MRAESVSRPRTRSTRVTGDAQDPAFDLCDGALVGGQVRFEIRGQIAVPVGMRQPGRDAVGIVLIVGAALPVDAATPQYRVNLSDGRASGRDIPAIEGPEVHTLSNPLTDEA